MLKNKLIGVSLFSGAGIGEIYLHKIVEIKVANELLEKRAELYKYFYPKTNMISGNIRDINIKKNILKEIKKNKCNFLMATPPCQGMSSLGKKEYSTDQRNYLVFEVIEVIDESDFDYILIENVPKFLKLIFPYNDSFYTLEDILKHKYSIKYCIESLILNASDFLVPQSRPRAFIKIWKKKLNWPWPKKHTHISLRDAIGHLPSLESGQKSSIANHISKSHNSRDILAMKHTPEGKSALKNIKFYPKKENGTAIKGFHNTYRRMSWDKPAPARAMNSGNIGGHNNVHPGRKLKDGTYSDARVLTLRELLIVSSLPPDMIFPKWCTDSFIRNIIGEGIPPKLTECIISTIKEYND